MELNPEHKQGLLVVRTILVYALVTLATGFVSAHKLHQQTRASITARSHIGKQRCDMVNTRSHRYAQKTDVIP